MDLYSLLEEVAKDFNGNFCEERLKMEKGRMIMELIVNPDPKLNRLPEEMKEKVVRNRLANLGARIRMETPTLEFLEAEWKREYEIRSLRLKYENDFVVRGLCEKAKEVENEIIAKLLYYRDGRVPNDYWKYLNKR